jgi:hypothetical protein
MKDESEIERIRAMMKDVPKNARMVVPPTPPPSDTELFDDGEKTTQETVENKPEQGESETETTEQ